MSSKLALKAHQLVHIAVRKGELEKPLYCELCGKPARGMLAESVDLETRKRTRIIRYYGIVGHHYLGYEGENALKVWFVCLSCNAHLTGRHDGSLTQEEARAFIQAKQVILFT